MKNLAFSIALFVGVFVMNAANADHFTNYTTKENIAYPLSRVSPFCMAIVKGDFETVQKLVAMGADVNEKSNGLTPLMYAAKYNRVDIVKLLLEKGANINAKDAKNGFTALKFAELSNAREAYLLLEKALDV